MARNSHNTNLFETLNANDQVAIAGYLSGFIGNQGRYTVTEKNKTRIRFNRISDNHERVFSVRTGYERDNGGKYSIANSFVETLEKYEKRLASQELRNHLNSAWSELEQAVSRKDVSLAKELLSKVEDMDNRWRS